MQDLGDISREQAHKILAALNNPKSCLLCVRYDQYEEMFLDCGKGPHRPILARQKRNL